MKAGLLSLNPDINVTTKCTGVLDSISERREATDGKKSPR